MGKTERKFFFKDNKKYDFLVYATVCFCFVLFCFSTIQIKFALFFIIFIKKLLHSATNNRRYFHDVIKVEMK